VVGPQSLLLGGDQALAHQELVAQQGDVGFSSGAYQGQLAAVVQQSRRESRPAQPGPGLCRQQLCRAGAGQGVPPVLAHQRVARVEDVEEPFAHAHAQGHRAHHVGAQQHGCLADVVHLLHAVESGGVGEAQQLGGNGWVGLDGLDEFLKVGELPGGDPKDTGSRRWRGRKLLHALDELAHPVGGMLGRVLTHGVANLR